METKQINDLINRVIQSDEFKKIQTTATEIMFEEIKDFPFESDDDVRLVFTRIRDVFTLGFNFQTSREMTKYMGINNK